MVACNSGGGSSSPAPNGGDKSDDGGDGGSGDGDKTPELVDNADISFSSVDITADTVIGMREFLFTLTYENLTDKKELNFIVGETSTPPTWNTVKDHATKITRAFDSDALKSRRIYFSTTEELTGISFDATGDATMSGKEVDLSQDGKTEPAITKADAPGIMVPASSYYVFVYDDAGRLVKQQQVTTAGYPSQESDFTKQVGGSDRTIPTSSRADYGEYIWGMDGWKSSNGVYYIVKGVEVKKGEVFFLPMRVRSPSDWDLTSSNYCTGLHAKELRLRRSIGGEAPQASSTFTPSGVDSTTRLFSFTESPALFTAILPASETDETLDLMYLARTSTEYDIYEVCLDGGAGLALASDKINKPSFTLVDE